MPFGFLKALDKSLSNPFSRVSGIKVGLVSCKELVKLLNEKRVILLDVRFQATSLDLLEPTCIDELNDFSDVLIADK